METQPQAEMSDSHNEAWPGHVPSERPDDALLEVIDPRISLTLDELSQCQQLAGKHITFSLTLACPLKCAHCIVDAGPNKGWTTMPLVVAERYAGQMRELAEYGIEGICFTGGEPTLARRQLKAMSKAAQEAGIAVSIVTAAQWAATPESAARTLSDFDAIGNWDVSFDTYHLPWVGFGHISNAFEAVTAAGRKFMLRFTYSDPLSDDELEMLRSLKTLKGARVAAQCVRAVGRGEEVTEKYSDKYNPWVKPCLTQGMVVRYDGSVAPCCLNMVESREHPFQLGDSRIRRLVQVHRDYMRMPLLHLIRSLGFGQLMRWLQEEGLDHLLPDQLPGEACEMCTLMLHNKTIAEFLTRKCQEPENRLRIGLIAAQTLNETALLESAMQDPRTCLGEEDRGRLTRIVGAVRGSGAQQERTAA
jgi:pyruvate-formate lyase-activating enzyme